MPGPICVRFLLERMNGFQKWRLKPHIKQCFSEDEDQWFVEKCRLRSRRWPISTWHLKWMGLQRDGMATERPLVFFSQVHSWLATCPWPTMKEQGCREVDVDWGRTADLGPQLIDRPPSCFLQGICSSLVLLGCPWNLPERKHWVCLTSSFSRDAFFLQMRAYRELSKLKLQGLSFALVGAPPCSINLFCCKIFKSHIL